MSVLSFSVPLLQGRMPVPRVPNREPCSLLTSLQEVDQVKTLLLNEGFVYVKIGNVPLVAEFSSGGRTTSLSIDLSPINL